MKDISSELQYQDKTYKIIFNLNVMEAIQNEYGSLEEWGNQTENADGEPNVKGIVFAFTQMINEGIEIDNDANGTDAKPLTTKQVARILSELGLEYAMEKLNEAVAASTKSADQRKNESSKTKSTQS